MRHSKMVAIERTGLLLGALAPGWWLCRTLLGAHRDAFTIALYVWIMAATHACWRWLGPQDRPDLSRSREWATALSRGVAIGLFMLAVQCTIMTMAGCWHPVRLTAWIWAGMLAKALPLALAEEYLFRGYLFGGFSRDLPRTTAYAFACGLFSLAHIFRPGTWDHRLGLAIGLFLASAALCRLVEVSGSLWPAVGVHTAWIAAIAVVPPASVQSGLLGGPQGDVAAGLISWTLFALLYALAPAVAGRDTHFAGECG